MLHKPRPTKQFDAFGNLVFSTGSTPTPFGFAGGWGYQADSDSGLKLLGHRYNDSGTGTTSWTYDAAGRVTQLVTPQGTMSYTYSDDGSRASMTDSSGTTTYTYNAAGNLVSLENQFGEETTWTYDNAGRTTRQTFDSGTYTAYGYDARHRVTTLEHKTSANSLISGEAY